jgi:proline-specific peptidase
MQPMVVVQAVAGSNPVRAIVFYDQIGCGKSDHPDDASLWTMPTFVEEVGAVRDALGLGRVHLLGHYWGGWLALEYALGQPSGLASLVLASTCASLPAFAAETRRLKESLRADVQEVIDRHEAEGSTDDPAYREAAMAYITRWVCRLDPWPEHVTCSFTNLSGDVYGTMQGPEWNVTGNLRDWDESARLGELEPPVLVTSGRHDEMTPALVRPLVDGIRGAEWVVFEESAHLAMAEEPDRYRDVLGSFLGRVEEASA